MQRATLNLALDAVLLAVCALLVWLCVAVDVLFPPPTQAIGWRLWGLGYDGWARLRLFVAAGFAVLVLLHVMLHWSWVCGVVAKKLSVLLQRKVAADEANQTLIGVAFLLLILHVLGLAYLIASLQIVAPTSTLRPMAIPANAASPGR